MTSDEKIEQIAHFIRLILDLLDYDRDYTRDEIAYELTRLTHCPAQKARMWVDFTIDQVLEKGETLR